MELASVEDYGSGPRLGDGELPQELNRLNWGALLLGMLWALIYAPWPWFFILAGARIGLAAAGFYFHGLFPGQSLQLAFTLAYVGLYWALVVVFAFRANSLAWMGEGSRVARQSDQSVPRPAKLVTEYVSAQSKWIIGGIIYHFLMWANVLKLSGVALNGAGDQWGQYMVIVIDVAVISCLFVLERVKSPRSAS